MNTTYIIIISIFLVGNNKRSEVVREVGLYNDTALRAALTGFFFLVVRSSTPCLRSLCFSV